MHYKDTVNALLVISNKGKIGQSYNISTSKLSSIKDILNYLAKKFSVKLITPIAMSENLNFAIREGGKTVGAGVVTKIIK